ncbi:MAG TPA: FAD-dependent oxidoreductase, partial [Nitrososphaera sp.]|nr:FAD-dependent oxidoreductase [Nitrososphaera sp.]
WNSQSTVSEGIENWIGTIKIPGMKFAEALENHLRAYAGDIVDIKVGVLCNKITQTKEGFSLDTDKGEFKAKTILIATGSSRRKLNIINADKYEHKGITYCASCDGPLFADQDVAVIGGGNAAFESAAQLLAYCKSVTLLNRSDEFKADPVTVKKVLSNPKMHAILGAAPVEVKGDKFVKSLLYLDKDSGEHKEISVTGIFVEIGNVPTTGFAKDLVTLDPFGRIVADPKTQATSIEGIWAAGDCTDGLYHQNNIAAGDAIKALEDIYVYLHTK